jgi:hypothetical protein
MNMSITDRQHGWRPMTRSAWWSLGLLAATVPILVLAVVVIEAIASSMGMGMGTPANADEVRAQDWLNYGFFAVVAAPMLASFLVGVRAWRRAHDAVALTAGLIAAAMLVGAAAIIVSSWT